jgi:mono/diheme cytochrome c family protein
MRFITRAIVALLALLVIGAGVVYGLAQRRLGKEYELVRRSVELPTDSASIARGAHLATAIGKCGDCHGDDLGGKVVIDDPALGRFSGPNLTTGRGGIGGARSDADLVTALRHGVGKEGRTLVFMPSEDYTHFSEADLRDLLAYVRSRPPVDRDIPARRLGPIGLMLVATDQFMVPAPKIDHGAIPPDSVLPAPTAEYGAYLARVGGCTGCHNPALSGGPAGGPPGTPPAANLTSGGRTWSLEEFTVALRDGVRPGGTKIDPFMPVQYTKLMTDQEIEAVWRYVTSVPAKAFAER